jgi:predicted SAM-dependent methyltransferase
LTRQHPIAPGVKILRTLPTRLIPMPNRVRRAWRWRYLPPRAVIARAYLQGSGLEIGALNKPLRVPRGVRVVYVDRLDAEGLAAHYPEVDATTIVPIDVVEDGERLTTIADASHDFVIANHVLEHCEDPIGTIINHVRVLRPRGILFLAVPDKRFTFDRNRPVTSLQHLIDDHERGAARSRRAHLHEWARLVEHVPEEKVADHAAYLDRINYSIHFHVWTPVELLETIVWLRRERALPIQVEYLAQRGDEIVLVLRKVAADESHVGA